MSNSPTATVAEAVATDGLLQPRRELHNYSDHANEADTGILEDSDGKPTHASDRNFPVKLHYMLSELEDDEQDHIVGWAPHGRCFVVHDQVRWGPEFFLSRDSYFVKDCSHPRTSSLCSAT